MLSDFYKDLKWPPKTGQSFQLDTEPEGVG